MPSIPKEYLRIFQRKIFCSLAKRFYHAKRVINQELHSTARYRLSFRNSVSNYSSRIPRNFPKENFHSLATSCRKANINKDSVELHSSACSRISFRKSRNRLSYRNSSHTHSKGISAVFPKGIHCSTTSPRNNSIIPCVRRFLIDPLGHPVSLSLRNSWLVL